MIHFKTIRITHQGRRRIAVSKILKNLDFGWSFYFNFRVTAIRKIPLFPLAISPPILDNEFVHVF